MAKSITQDILNTFPPSSKADWEVKASKDLKENSLGELTWEISEEIRQSPFYTAEDKTTIDPSALKQHQPDWQIGELYVIDDVKKSNKQLLADLMHGLNAPVIQFSNEVGSADIAALFNAVGMEYIFTHFKAMSEGQLAQVNEYMTKQGVEAALYFESDTVLPAAKSVLIDAQKYYHGVSHTADELKAALSSVREILKSAENPSLMAGQIQCKFFVDNAYLLNIAKLRAFKLLYVQLLKELALPVSLPFMKVGFAPSAYGDDEQDNLIRATSMAMSAVMGGADHLIVRPTSDTPRAKRLARNIQLILKYESGLHKIADPAAGSYYIENLTQKLVHYCS